VKFPPTPGRVRTPFLSALDILDHLSGHRISFHYPGCRTVHTAQTGSRHGIFLSLVSVSLGLQQVHLIWVP
jgi:hypothetical protein